MNPRAILRDLVLHGVISLGIAISPIEGSISSAFVQSRNETNAVQSGSCEGEGRRTIPDGAYRWGGRLILSGLPHWYWGFDSTGGPLEIIGAVRAGGESLSNPGALDSARQTPGVWTDTSAYADREPSAIGLSALWDGDKLINASHGWSNSSHRQMACWDDKTGTLYIRDK